jgi:molybdenum cofactor synthesis domain-containing protein
LVGLAVVFHRLLDIDEALRKLDDAMGGIKPLGSERVILSDALGRILAQPVEAKVDSPPFDRSEVDGYAVESKSLYGAEEDKPVRLKVVGESRVGALPHVALGFGEAVEIATGAPIPRGANAVAMVEYTKEEHDGTILVYRSLVPGENVAQAGSDVMVGDLALRRGVLLTYREIAVLAALGYGEVVVHRRPSVAVLSIGDELAVPGDALAPGKVYDVNGVAISQMVRELGATPQYLGIVPDSYEGLRKAIGEALQSSDMVLTSGSTSAGLGDVIYRIFDELGKPGIVVHGLKIKPGKPTVAAVVNGVLAVGLPGFPVSAMIAFSVFVQPMLLKMMGRGVPSQSWSQRARLAYGIQAGRGKREYIPVNLVSSPEGVVAYPLLKGSGATSTLAWADGFFEVGEKRESLEEGELVGVRLFSHQIQLAELTIIGSHCPGVDLVLELMGEMEAKVINIGSTGGWLAVKRGEADIAGTHLLDAESLVYNVPFLSKYDLKGKAAIFRGYARRQGFLVAKGNPKGIGTFKDFTRGDVIIINRNSGSGTRAFIDHNLKEIGVKPVEGGIRGYDHEAKTHSAVAAAVAQGRADVGVSLEAYAEAYGLEFLPLGEEIYDFLVAKERLEKRAVKGFIATLAGKEFAEALCRRLKGYRILPDTGKFVSE